MVRVSAINKAKIGAILAVGILGVAAIFVYANGNKPVAEPTLLPTPSETPTIVPSGTSAPSAAPASPTATQAAAPRFDKCGQISTYRQELWFEKFTSVMQSQGMDPGTSGEACYSRDAGFFVFVRPAGLASSDVYRYETASGLLAAAKYVNPGPGGTGTQSYPSQLTAFEFGVQEGSIIHMKGGGGDGGCGTEDSYDYNFVDNTIRITRSVLKCQNAPDKVLL